MSRPFFFESRSAITRVDEAITGYNEAVNKHLKNIQRTRREHRYRDEGVDSSDRAKYKIIKREDERKQFYSRNSILTEIREALNWYIVWLVVKQEHKSKKEVFSYRVHDFIDIVVFVIKEMQDGLKS